MSAQLTHFCSAACTVSNTIKQPLGKRTKKEYAVMIKVVRKGYEQLSNSDKYIYELLTEFDFADTITGLCKGYIFPSARTIATECKIPIRTLYRHLANLENAGLIKRIRRQYRGAVIKLVDIPEQILSTYRNERQLPILANVYNRNLLTNRRIIANVGNFDFLFSAREHTCYERLVSWGYHATQAIRDISNPEIGAQKVEQRLSDLHTLLRAGWTPRQTFAQWLNWALRSNERIETRDAQVYPPADRPAKPRFDLEEFEDYTDSQGYITYRPKRVDAGDELASASGDPTPPTSSETRIEGDSTVVPLDEYDSIKQSNLIFPYYLPYERPSSLISASFPLPESGGGYCHSTIVSLPHHAAPARFSSSFLLATRPPFHRFTKTVYYCFWKGGLVDRSGRGLLSGVCESECEKESESESEKLVEVRDSRSRREREKSNDYEYDFNEFFAIALLRLNR